MHRDPRITGRSRRFWRHVAQDLNRVAQVLDDPPRLRGIDRVVDQYVGIVADEGGAAAGVDDDGFTARIQGGGPGVNVAACKAAGGLGRVEMEVQGAAATHARRLRQVYANGVEHPRRGRVEVGRGDRLHAAVKQGHAPRMGSGRRRSRGGPGRNLADQAPGRHERRNQGGARHDRADRPAIQAIWPGSPDFFRHHGPANVQKSVIFHARRAGGFARPARQAAIQMRLGQARYGIALQRLFDQIDAPARSVGLITGQLKGRAGGVAHAAVDAGAEDRLRGRAGGGLGERAFDVAAHA